MFRKFTEVLILLIPAIFIFTACGTNKAESEKIRNRIGPMAERILKAIDENNYSFFSSDFDKKLKTDFPETKFRDLSIFLKNNQGTFVSKSFYSIIKDKYILTVQYFVIYTNKNPTYVLSLTFNNTDGSGPITGFNLVPFNVSR